MSNDKTTIDVEVTDVEVTGVARVSIGYWRDPAARAVDDSEQPTSPHGDVRRTITLTEYADGTIERIEVDAHGTMIEHGIIERTIPKSVLPFSYALEGR